MTPCKSGSRLALALSLVGATFLVFTTGAFFADFQIPPYRQLYGRAFKFAHAMIDQQQELAQSRSEFEQAPKFGKVTIPAGPEAFDGYTFVTFDAARPSTARLLDMQGNVVHEWHKPLAEIFPDHPLWDHPWPEYSVAWRFGRLMPNGDIIVTIKGYGDTPEGCGIARLDKDSKVIWAIAGHFHHQFSIGEDGRVYAIQHQYRFTDKNPVEGAAYLPPIALEDFVVEISPDGKVLSRTSITEAMTVPGYRELVSSAIFKGYYTKKWDRMHPNDVQIINEEFASHHSFMKPGMVFLSFRDLDTLAVLDLKEKKIVWALRGAWLRQHNPQLLNNGHVLLFDNRGNDSGVGGGSRALEVDLEPNRIVWSYTGTKDHPFQSDVSGGVERLPNGNTLISEDDGGRLLEVTPDKRIVWEYRDVRLHHPTRITKDWATFLK